jgi:tetratricopeptide (TPR) repeat protein
LGDSAISKGNNTAAKAHYEEALKNHLISLEKYKQQDILGGYAGQYFYIGTTHLKLNRIPDAKKYLQIGLRLFVESGSKEMAGETYIYLSRMTVWKEIIKMHSGITSSRLFTGTVFLIQNNQERLPYTKSSMKLKRKRRKLNFWLRRTN